MNLYIISGSPCAGKTTLAERLAAQRGCQLYQLDDDLVPFMEQLAAAGNEACREGLEPSFERMWMRDPRDMCAEEIGMYRDMLPLAMAKLGTYDPDRIVVAEGAGFLPEEIAAMGIPVGRYVCITPTREFQVEHYAKRPWISEFLKGCSDPDQAFRNWMERDALFGEYMAAGAAARGYHTIKVDGSRTVDDHYHELIRIFGL